MQKKLKLITILFTLFIIGFVWLAPSPMVFAGAEKADAPRDLYLRNCARCHGADGKSETKLGNDLAAPDLTSRAIKRKSRSKIARVIANGDGEMPGFGKKLSKADINLLVNYVRSL